MIAGGDEVKRVEQAVLEALKSSRQPESPREVITNLVKEGLQDSAIREAIWRLIDRKQIQLTLDRKLELS